MNRHVNKALLAAGGTGGHMFPAQSLAEILKDKGWEITLMTDARGRKHAGKIPADHVMEVEAASISPRRPLKAIGGARKLMRGVRQARGFIRDWHPDIVIGFGGYPAFPALKAGQAMGLPSILHEQNAVLGRVNRVFARRADWVVSGFDVLEKLPKGAKWQVLGNPVRADIVRAAQRPYQPPDHTSGAAINLLIVGGSLGARLLSETMPKAVAELSQEMRARLHVVQQTRPESLELAQNLYREAGVQAECAPFFENIETYLARAHYIVARAGASSVTEIALMGLPSLLVPLAIAMDDHQSKNALPLKNLDAADILPESRFTPENITHILMERLNDSSWLETASRAAKSLARPKATTDLAELVMQTAKR